MSNNKVYIKVPFNEKDEAKSRGAKFDGDTKMWFIPENKNIDYSQFSRWQIYLNSSFNEKDEVKSKGAKWDADLKKWYIPPGFSISEFTKWLPTQSIVENNIIQSSSQNSPKKSSMDSQIQINLVIPSSMDSTKENDATSELQKIKKDIKSNCSFNVSELKDLLKSKGVKGISTLSKQELIDKCMELKLLNTVLQVAAPIVPKKE